MNKPFKKGDRIIKQKVTTSLNDATKRLIFHLGEGMPMAYIEGKGAEGEVPILIEKPVDWNKMLCSFYEKIQAPHEEKMRKLLGWMEMIKSAHTKKAAKIGAFHLKFRSTEDEVKAEKRVLRSEVRLEDPTKHKQIL